MAEEPSRATDGSSRSPPLTEASDGNRHGTSLFAVHPARVLAWTDAPADGTRWRFDG